MIHFRVLNLEAMVAQLRCARRNHDPEGNAIELREPAGGDGSQTLKP